MGDANHATGETRSFGHEMSVLPGHAIAGHRSVDFMKRRWIMAVYRRKEDSTLWHWCTNCPRYPTGAGIISRHTKPEYGEFCKDCATREEAGDCMLDSLFTLRK